MLWSRCLGLGAASASISRARPWYLWAWRGVQSPGVHSWAQYHVPPVDDDTLMGVDESASGAAMLGRARLRARNTRQRSPPPLRGIPGTPRLPQVRRGPDGEVGFAPEQEGDCYINRRALPLAPPPPGLRGEPRLPPPSRWRPKGVG
mmetsp:Transcript_119169/g.379866  ORF Transcript_119169/g.379866 Transcript_119169/m.379866 type:complete len:147 (-) Transcript_119169:37-477(-)